MIASSLCDFCCMYVENIKHLFWECMEIQHVWMHIRVFLHERGVNYDVNFLNISFGINENTIGAKQFNFIILLAKYFIFKCKYEKM